MKVELLNDGPVTMIIDTKRYCKFEIIEIFNTSKGKSTIGGVFMLYTASIANLDLFKIKDDTTDKIFIGCNQEWIFR